MTVPRDWYRGRQGSCFEYQLRPFSCTVLTWLTRDAIFLSISTLIQAYFIASAVSYLYSIDKNVFQKVFNIILDSIFFLHFLRNCNPVYPLNAYIFNYETFKSLTVITLRHLKLIYLITHFYERILCELKVTYAASDIR